MLIVADIEEFHDKLSIDALFYAVLIPKCLELRRAPVAAAAGSLLDLWLPRPSNPQ